MDFKQKRILSLLAFVAVCAVFFFAWLITGQGNESEPALASQDNVEETQKEETKDSNPSQEGAEKEDFSMAETITLERDKKEETPSESADQSSSETTKENTPTQQVGLASLMQSGGTVKVKDNGYLDDKSTITMNGWSSSEWFVINGQQFTEGLGFKIDYGTRTNMGIPSVRVPLNQEYTKLTGKIGIDDSFMDAESQYRVDFYAQNLDNTTTHLYSSDWLQPGNFAVPFEIDVTNVQMLIIELVKSDENDDEAKVAIVDTKLE